MVYNNPVDYYTNAGADIKARVNRLTTIIYNLEGMMVNVGEGGNIQNYSFNDGQSTINTNYRTLNDILTAIKGFEILRERLLNKIKGNITILRDTTTLPRRG
jgi:hypothetical protein